MRLNRCSTEKRMTGVIVALMALMLLAGCGSSFSPKSSEPPTPASLSANNLNLIFVVSEDLAYQASGDVNPSTANLTNQGLQRSLLMATFLQQQVLGMQNVTGIYALEPMTHLQTANKYPDIVALETIQQFAMLNQTSASYQGSPLVTANSYPIFASYSLEAALPDDVAPPAPPTSARLARVSTSATRTATTKFWSAASLRQTRRGFMFFPRHGRP